jgi:hypothetical protein
MINARPYRFAPGTMAENSCLQTTLFSSLLFYTGSKCRPNVVLHQPI